jgi:hypothetical protein
VRRVGADEPGAGAGHIHLGGKGCVWLLHQSAYARRPFRREETSREPTSTRIAGREAVSDQERPPDVPGGRGTPGILIGARVRIRILHPYAAQLAIGAVGSAGNRSLTVGRSDTYRARSSTSRRDDVGVEAGQEHSEMGHLCVAMGRVVEADREPGVIGGPTRAVGSVVCRRGLGVAAFLYALTSRLGFHGIRRRL